MSVEFLLIFACGALALLYGAFAVRSVLTAPAGTDRMREIGERSSASLVRGRDRHGNFDPEPVPQYDYDPAALAVFEAQQARYKTVAPRASGPSNGGKEASPTRPAG